MAVATVGVGWHRRGRRARVRGRQKLTEGVWWTALHHFVWLESAGGWAVACGIFGLVGQLVSGGTGEGVARGAGDGRNRPRGCGGMPFTTLFAFSTLTLLPSHLSLPLHRNPLPCVCRSSHPFTLLGPLPPPLPARSTSLSLSPVLRSLAPFYSILSPPSSFPSSPLNLLAVLAADDHHFFWSATTTFTHHHDHHRRSILFFPSPLPLTLSLSSSSTLSLACSLSPPSPRSLSLPSLLLTPSLLFLLSSHSLFLPPVSSLDHQHFPSLTIEAHLFPFPLLYDTSPPISHYFFFCYYSPRRFPFHRRP